MAPPTEFSEYRENLKRVYLCAYLLRAVPIDEMLEAIRRDDAFMPFFEPTLWIEKRGLMAEDRAALEAALPLQAVGKKLQVQTTK